jgi:hypothetical protein
MAKQVKKTAVPRAAGLWAKIGVWSYIAGLLIALLVSIFSAGKLEPWSVGTLAILGIIVGLVNIAESEVTRFLLATIAFIIAAGALSEIFAQLGIPFSSLQTFMDAIIVFTAPGALLVSFKALYEVAKDD